MEKNPTSSFKIGDIFRKKIKIPIGRRPFFESMSEAKCPEKPLANPKKPLANAEKPLANSEKPLANECGRRVYLTTTPLPYQPPAKPVVMSDQKMFSDFLGVFSEIRFRWNKCAAIWKICEKHFFTGKKSDFKFQNRGYFGKKNPKPHR